MRIYNGTNSQLNLPLSGMQRLDVSPHSVSGDFMPSIEFLSLMVGSYDYSEIALIVSGPFELNMCASVSGSVGFVVQSLDEAVERFASKDKDVVSDPKKEEQETIKCDSDEISTNSCRKEVNSSKKETVEVPEKTAGKPKKK